MVVQVNSVALERRKRFFRRAKLTLLLPVLFGCNSQNTLHELMLTSLEEQFSEACAESHACVAAVEKHMASCFDRNLATAAVEAPTNQKKAINAKHIRHLQACIATNAGTDYWASIDLPTLILSKVD